MGRSRKALKRVGVKNKKIKFMTEKTKQNLKLELTGFNLSEVKRKELSSKILESIKQEISSAQGHAVADFGLGFALSILPE